MGTPFKVFTIGFFNVEASLLDQNPAQLEKLASFPITDISPIPLNDEWLKRFGFTHEDTNGGWSKWSNGKIKLLDMKFYNGDHSVPVRHVHILQNIYFFTVGEELFDPWNK